MASISASTLTLIPKKRSTLHVHGLQTTATCQMGKVRCSTEKVMKRESMPRLVTTGVSSLVATTVAATMSSPIAVALVDERMSTEGTGLPFGLSNNLLGWILFGVFGFIWTLYFVYTGSLDEDEDSGLSL
ncbi:unnamed protein product [Lactuca virosa]|uniref:PSII 6.1 kDa protein n=1 Tax=Lactuca virosa TaxID=75947 RepID=A0AAU9PAZ8_9ASTR|nr:unnamed protein product [Lactuca virosa]